jgi:hypothetical protein
MPQSDDNLDAPSYAAAARLGKANAAAPLLHDKCAPQAHPLLRHRHLADPTRGLHVLALPTENVVTRVIAVSSLATYATLLPSAPSEG